MKRRSDNIIKNIHLLPGTDETQVRTRSGYVRRRRHPGWQMLGRLAVVAAILLVIFLIWRNWEKIAPEAVLDWADAQFGGGEVGEGYPYALDGNSVAGMGQVNDYLAVLTDSSLKFLNNTAGCVEERPNTLSDPLLKTAGRYVMIAEIGGSRFRLETRRETALEMELTNRKIYAADVASSGTVAVVTDSSAQNYVCGVQVYNSRGKLLYEYKSGKYLITNLSLAPGGKALAAVGTAAEGGMLKSVLLLFDLSSDTPKEHTGSDLLLYDVAHFGNTVLAVGDNEYWIASVSNGTVEKTPYNGMELMGYAASKTTAGLVMKQSGSTGTGEVWMFDSKGNLTVKHPFAGAFRYATCRESQFLVLTDSTLFALDDHEKGIQVNTPTDALMATEYRGSLMLLTLSELQQLRQ